MDVFDRDVSAHRHDAELATFRNANVEIARAYVMGTLGVDHLDQGVLAVADEVQTLGAGGQGTLDANFVTTPAPHVHIAGGIGHLDPPTRIRVGQLIDIVRSRDRRSQAQCNQHHQR